MGVVGFEKATECLCVASELLQRSAARRSRDAKIPAFYGDALWSYLFSTSHIFGVILMGLYHAMRWTEVKAL